MDQLYTVSRGKSPLVNGKNRDFCYRRKLEKLSQFAEEFPERTSDLINMVKNWKDDIVWNYGGFYSVGFKVDRPILLHSVGFYGPYDEEEGVGQFEVYVAVERQSKLTRKRYERLVKVETVIKAENESIFHVTFPRAVSIDPSVQHKIIFELKGPNTMRCEEESLKRLVFSGGVQFAFNSSSNQMPEMQFTIPR